MFKRKASDWMQTSTTKSDCRHVIAGCTQRLSTAVSGMLTVMATVLNPAQITPVSVQRRRHQNTKVPKPQDTDNRHICPCLLNCPGTCWEIYWVSWRSQLCTSELVGVGEGGKEPCHGQGMIILSTGSHKSVWCEWLWSSLAHSWFSSEPHSWEQ